MKIYAASPCETVLYAAEELKKYLEMMDSSVHAEIVKGEGTDGIILSVGLYDGVDPMIEDVIDAEIDCLKGYIRGSNGRSVLMGVYNYLKSAGCLWVRPGKKGEFIPEKEMGAHAFSMHKKADFPFRGECIEGAVSMENVIETVEWLPKVDMNLFMMEQIVPYNYMSRWYKHQMSRHKTDTGVTFEDVEKMIPVIEQFIHKCGLQLHALGHGYQLERYGIRYQGRHIQYELNEAARQDIALRNGTRELYLGSPNFTQMCMSSERARKGQVDFLVSYLERKPYIDFLHVWLADCDNNHCECEGCQKKTPSDFYVIMLNELDAELTARGIDTKIVFIMYTDTYWGPETERFNNPSRFIMTTAATGRDRSLPYQPERSKDPLPKYVRNKNKLHVTFPMSMSFADDWAESGFHGLKFIFEYNMYTYHYMDPGYMHLAREMLADARSVGKIGFDGVMQDMTQRSNFPTAFPMAIQGEALFDQSLDFDEYARKYFAAAFGADSEKAQAYLQGVSDIFMPELLRKRENVTLQDTGAGLPEERMAVSNATVQRLATIAGYVDAFAETVQKNLKAANACHAESWRILTYHREYCKLFADIFMAMASGDMEKARSRYERLWDYVSSIEDEVQPYLDMHLCVTRLGQLVEYSHK